MSNIHETPEYSAAEIAEFLIARHDPDVAWLVLRRIDLAALAGAAVNYRIAADTNPFEDAVVGELAYLGGEELLAGAEHPEAWAALHDLLDDGAGGPSSSLAHAAFKSLLLSVRDKTIAPTAAQSIYKAVVRAEVTALGGAA